MATFSQHPAERGTVKTSAQIARMSDRARVTQELLNEHLAEIGEGLLTHDELRGLRAALPKLADLALEMGCTDKVLSEWKREEIMRFLAVAVRAAVPLRVASFVLATGED